MARRRRSRGQAARWRSRLRGGGHGLQSFALAFRVDGDKLSRSFSALELTLEALHDLP